MEVLTFTGIIFAFFGKLDKKQSVLKRVVKAAGGQVSAIENATHVVAHLEVI
jgi:hypothetical protein